MYTLSPSILEMLRQHQQEHLLFGWDTLQPTEQQEFARQLQSVDPEQLAHLHTQYQSNQKPTLPKDIQPIPLEQPTNDPAVIRQGQESLGRGELAVVLVAGGQGSRLGFEKPKGIFPVGPVSGKSLFQIHAEKVLAIRRRYGQAVPFLIMTSPATHADTMAYLESQRYFGLPAQDVFFFQQATMPAIDLHTGKLLLEKPGSLFLSPNGHGGTLTALRDSGLLQKMADRGIKHIFYFQVDNPLVKIGEAGFLGQHIQVRSEASSKAIAKAYAGEKMGVFTKADGRCTIIEYSDMPDELKNAKLENGTLLHRAGSPAIHLFDLAFLQRIAARKEMLPWHFAEKKVRCLDGQGNSITPEKNNALKFEMFIFDILPMAERWLVVESARSEEFSPVKNATGEDSPRTAQQSMSNLYASWLEQSGIRIPRDTKGDTTISIEISPLFALDAAELHSRIWSGRELHESLYLS